jgi:hypothetical protein
MWNTFNIVGRIISILFGVVTIFLGIVWTLQAFNIAFNTPMVPGGPVSFMVNNHRWAFYGTIAVIVGVGQIVWSTTRPTPVASSPQTGGTQRRSTLP